MSVREPETERELAALFADIERDDLNIALNALGRLQQQLGDIPELLRARALIKRKEMFGK